MLSHLCVFTGAEIDGGGGGGAPTVSALAGAVADLEQTARLRAKLAALSAAASDDSLQLMPDYLQRVAVLRRLGYIGGASPTGGDVRLKGRAACEVNTADSLVLTELVFENVLDGRTPPEVAALLSALILQERFDSDGCVPVPTDGLRDRMAAVTRILTALGGVQAEAGLPVAPNEFVREAAKFGLVPAVHAWASGAPFRDICALVDAPEGTIVRCVNRLAELLREVGNVARVIGNGALAETAAEGGGGIRRDIIFAASLYVK
ncbi:hypothetical protein BU14_2803s0001 [Porphyra umbilicalis]|uniref:ATP-dependent RNA helicase Ski2/MTR4 C-terminal domain-containing protein n=1 Tax=Porphyra umbilicalis TaxID=2786 RepID=A0A1X6NJ09_PORUM|nr:hypothetical protein BU14_2803s0001 [Porphyra umbilicalis]|eukprot:OSX68436.1 hypothetical protein BU14_2803s0001 [Porphyra umbilicalis]